MNLRDKLSEGSNFVNKILWIIAIPITLDLVGLFSYERLFHTVYVPAIKIFTIKLGFMFNPPSVKYLLDDFPSTLFQYNNNALTGIITSFNLFNVLLAVTVLLIYSFIHSGYMSVIGTDVNNKISIKDFFIKGNKNWFKFYLFNCVLYLPLTFVLIDKSFILLSFVNVIFVFVKYSMVVDEVNILDNFKIGIRFLFCNLGLALKMALYYGFLFSLLSLLIYGVASIGTAGVVIDIIICAYFGAVINKAVMECYREQETLTKQTL